MINTVTISIEEYDNLRECKKFVDSTESVYLRYGGQFKVKTIDELIVELNNSTNSLTKHNSDLSLKLAHYQDAYRTLLKEVLQYNKLPWYKRIFSKISCED
jgi:hypothetical protein